jgi:hypothetical protein
LFSNALEVSKARGLLRAHEKFEKKKGKDAIALDGSTIQQKIDILRTEYSAVKDFLKSRLDSINKTTETANQIFQDKTSQILYKDWNLSKSDTPDAKSDTPDAKSDTPDVKSDTPDVKSDKTIKSLAKSQVNDGLKSLADSLELEI